MSRIYLGGALLRRNPSSITTNNIMPRYDTFQPLDGVGIPIEKKDRLEITLTWDRVSGTDLAQLMNIINSTQKDGSRETPVLYYNDYHLMDGNVVIVSASVIPVKSTGARMEYPWKQGTQTMVPLDASVTIVLVPYEYTVYRGV